MPENNSPTILNVSTFSLPLNITPMMHGTVYECQVTIDHNGTRKREYSGGHFKIVARMESGQLFIVYTTWGFWGRML